MNPDQLKALLEDVAAGKVVPADALERLAQLPFTDLGFAKLDLHREIRAGLPETVFGSGKSLDDLRSICSKLLEAHGRLLVTRLDLTLARKLLSDLPEAQYHERARVLTCGAAHPGKEGPVSLLAAGTSDLSVAEEVSVCASWFGLQVERHYDVGVAGLHRLLDILPTLRRAPVVVAVAGMDGALPTLVAGLVSSPVIAVPTSVGYGASLGGLAALLTMLNACAPGVAVVNIDNGYGAAVLARRIMGKRGDTLPISEK